MLARAPLSKESPVKNTTKISPKPADGNQQFSTEPQRPEHEFTAPKFFWSIGKVSISAPSHGATNPGDDGRTAPERRCFAQPPWPIQAKLEVGAVDDPLEREADRVAEQVMRMSEPRLQRKCSCGGTCRECSKKKEGEPKQGPVQMKHIGPSGPALAEAPPSVHDVLRSRGQRLDPATRAFMEPSFGRDFSGVRIHTDAAAAQSARDVNAHAYTVGHNIVFASGQYMPRTATGDRLIAHELTHVLQQLGADQINVGQSDDKRSLSPIAPVMQSPHSAIAPGSAVTCLGLRKPVGNRVTAGPLMGAVSSSPWRLARAPGDLADKIKKEEQDLEAAKEIAEDFLEQLGRSLRKGLGKGRTAGKRTVGQLVAALERIAKEGGAEAQKARGLAGELQASRRRIGDLHRERGTTGIPGKKVEYGGEKVGETAAKAEESAAKSTAKAETAAAKTSAKAEGAATKALVKAEETVIKAEAKLGSRVATRAGRLGLSLLLPGPEDAVMLLVDFAGSYQEAWDIIEQRYTRSGIAMGIAAGMMGLDGGWVQQNLWRRFATRDVATEVIGAVGKAERSYNDGLVRGHKYGAGHPQRAKDRILAEAFTILAQEGYKTSEEGLFTIDTVARVAGILMPIADDFLRQAAERKQAREERENEQRRREAKEWGSVGFKF